MVFTSGKSQLQDCIFSSLEQDMTGRQDHLDLTSNPATDLLIYLISFLYVTWLFVKEEMLVW